MPDVGAFENNQRVERGDMEFVADELPRNILLDVPGHALVNPAGQTAFILSGFDITNPSAKQLRVDRGVAILSMREGGTTFKGILTYEGDAQIIEDLAAKANGTYGVYIRFEFRSGSFANRVFWDGAGEVAQNMATKRVASWGMTVAPIGSLSSEWFHIADVVVSGSPTLTVTKKRKFFFEGDEASSFAVTWGAGNDRNADRAQYGVKDLQTFVQAMTKQLSGILGSGKKWYEAIVEGLEQKVSRNGDADMDGDYFINGRVIADSFVPTRIVAAGEAVGLEVTQRNIIRAEASIGFTNGGNPTLDGGTNIDSVVLVDNMAEDGVANARVRINLAGDWVGDHPTVLISLAAPNTDPRFFVAELLGSRSTGGFTFQIVSHAGVRISLDGATAAGMRLSFAMMCTQFAPDP